MPEAPKIFTAGRAGTDAGQFVVGLTGGTAIGVALHITLKHVPLTHLRIAHELSLSFPKTYQRAY